MRYEYRTSVGTFWIAPEEGDPKRVFLGIDNITIGAWDSALSAAADVYAQRTGWERWDLLRRISGPRDLSEWEQVGE